METNNDIFSRYPKGIYCIYEAEDPRNGKSVYIGFTNHLERRISQHVSKNGILYPLMQELQRIGLKLPMSVLDSALHEQEARQLEKTWIQIKKPLLNSIHNGDAINERMAARRFSEEVEDTMNKMGLTYEESILFVKHFCRSSGDEYNYAMIRETAQLVVRRLGLKPLTESEILDIALESYEVEQYK